MSGGGQDDDGVPERIRQLIDSLPPKPGRRSRIGHISIEDFAELAGVSKGRLIAWMKGEASPDAKNRARLAAASQGRYQAEDFIGREELERGEQRGRLEELEAALNRLAVDLPVLAGKMRILDRTARQNRVQAQELLDRMSSELADLSRRVSALEQQAPPSTAEGGMRS